MKLVLKIGGAALEDDARVRAFAGAVAALATGHRVAIVHGGGAALTRTLAEMGRESTFAHGLRVTDAKTRDVAVMVLGGHANKRLVSAIDAAGVPAAGLCGSDLRILRAAKKNGVVDLGFVGEVREVHWRWVDTLWNGGAVPVIASIAAGDDGELYNVNADEVASACAVACHADALVFLTDVNGVRDADGRVIERLSAARVAGMAHASIISGGMLPKLAACASALDGGVASVRIMPAALAGTLPGVAAGSLHHGTEVVTR